MRARRRTERFSAHGLTAVVHVSAAVPSPTRAVVLVHGVGSSSRAFRSVARLLVASREVHAVDLPGFGASPRTRGDVTVEDHAAVVAAYVRTRILGAGLPPPVVVGHSMGAQVVGQLLADSPDVAAAGILVGPTADPRSRTVRGQAVRLARDAVGESPRTVGVLLVDTLARCGVRYYLAQLRNVVGHRLEDALPSAVVPVVVARGDHDAVAGAPWVAALSRSAHRGEARTLRGRHHAMDSDPEGLCALVLGCGEPAQDAAR